MSIIIDDVHFNYGEMQMRFDTKLPANRITSIIGPSGSGKSTLLNIIAGFETPLSGKVIINGQDMSDLLPSERPVSMVFQDNNLFAHLDVTQNVGLGRSGNLKLVQADHQAIKDAIARVGLSGKEHRKPEALSGGERQRVAIARALVRQKPVLLLDEAFASLGPALRHQMLDLIDELQQENAMNILMVTHTPEDALRLKTWLVFVEAGQISATGEAEHLLSSLGPQALQHYMGNQLT
ncbi:ATP-binding cassette domain-containing protein [Paenochrobactrum sp. BZR 588]|uniref:thiamine ABC transporter ATP-binding protein n=1 Tax=unclassified Paenochrobactrum TaxID=2639760 RepID=UPI00385469AC